LAVQDHPRSLILYELKARMRLPISSSYGPILTVSEILQIVCSETDPHSGHAHHIFHSNFGDVPVGPMFGWSRTDQNRKRISHEIIFEVF